MRSMSARPLVSVRRNEAVLARCSPSSKAPKWSDLPAGRHLLDFTASRGGQFISSFKRELRLERGDVLVVICEPIQPWSLLGKSPSANRWYIGVLPLPDHAAGR